MTKTQTETTSARGATTLTLPWRRFCRGWRSRTTLISLVMMAVVVAVVVVVAMLGKGLMVLERTQRPGGRVVMVVVIVVLGLGATAAAMEEAT